VRILPFIGEQELYGLFRLDQPWDSEHNKRLIERMPDIYKAPGSKAAEQFKTVYLAPRGVKTILSGDRELSHRQIPDGVSNTIAVVEASDAKAVIWTKPDDYQYDPKRPQAGLVGLREDGFLAMFANGQIRFIAENTPAATLNALYTRDGKERIAEPPPLFKPEGDGTASKIDSKSKTDPAESSSAK
jgi:hypothetical protein